MLWVQCLTQRELVDTSEWAGLSWLLLLSLLASGLVCQASSRRHGAHTLLHGSLGGGNVPVWAPPLSIPSHAGVLTCQCLACDRGITRERPTGSAWLLSWHSARAARVSTSPWSAGKAVPSYFQLLRVLPKQAVSKCQGGELTTLSFLRCAFKANYFQS